MIRSPHVRDLTWIGDLAAWMRVAARLLILVFLAACGDSGLPPLPTDQVRVRFPPGGVVDTIQVDAIDRLPLRSVELIAPDGVAEIES